MNSSHLNLLLGALVWFGIVTWLAAKGVFVSAPDERPLTLALAFVAPILLFLVAVRFSRWRELIFSIPPVFLIALKAGASLVWHF
jgi:membrane protein DedA with SNARE-associated domain